MLAGAVADGAHGVLHGAVLGVGAGDSGKGPRLLQLAVDEVVVFRAGPGLEARLDVDVLAELVAGALQQALVLR